MILLMVLRVWQFAAETLQGIKILFGGSGKASYVEGVAGVCVTLSSCSQVITKYTLPLLRGLIATESGPFFFAPVNFSNCLSVGCAPGFEYFENNEAVTIPLQLNENKRTGLVRGLKGVM